MNENVETKVFCSQCDRVTSDFLEWGDEFWCEEECVALLPMEEDHSSVEEDHDWLVSAGWGDDEDYGYFG
jgi:hypothetical protein